MPQVKHAWHYFKAISMAFSLEYCFHSPLPSSLPFTLIVRQPLVDFRILKQQTDERTKGGHAFDPHSRETAVQTWKNYS